jgi:hypothetical protein
LVEAGFVGDEVREREVEGKRGVESETKVRSHLWSGFRNGVREDLFLDGSILRSIHGN